MEQASKKMQHESLGSDSTATPSKRLKVVRQDRISVEDVECYIEVPSSQQKFRVLNVSSFGALVQFEQNVSNDIMDIRLILDNIDLGAHKVRVARLNDDDKEKRQMAFEVIGEPIGMERVHAALDSKRVISNQEKYNESTKKVPDLFARKVYEIKDWLEEIQNNISAIEKKRDKNDHSTYAEYEGTLIQIIGDYLNSILPAKNADLSKLLRGVDPDTVIHCYEFLRSKLKDLVYQAPFADRVYNKPLGYAGDYEMMNIIYRDTHVGDTLFAKCLQHYWVQQPAAQAVRNRAEYIKSKINEHLNSTKRDTISFLSVACGPAMEWQKMLSERRHNKKQLAVDLLDQDEEALKHSQRKLKEIILKNPSQIEFNFIPKAIKHVLARGLNKKYDFIYSAGLFDYFSEPVAQLAAIKLYEALNPGGQLIIGNFNVSNPNSLVMDLVLDWHLIYRTKEDLIRMFGHTGGHIYIESEPLDINLFCVITKK